MLAAVRLAVALLAAAVTAMGAIPRILLAAGLLPDGLHPFVWSDVFLIYVRGLSGHRLPYIDTAFEYPPLVAAASGLFSAVSDGPVLFVGLWSVVQTVVAGAVAWTLAGAADSRRTMWRFALAPQLLLLGAANFDLLAVAFFVAAIVAARARNETRAAVWLAVGTLSKLFPILAAPALILRAARPARVALVGAAIVLAGYVTASLAGRSAAGGPFYYLIGIEANFDSPWGLVARALDAAGVQGGQQIIVVVTLIGLAATFVLGVLPRARAADPAVPFGLAIVATLIWSRLYSPQYSLWLLPLFVLLPLRGRVFALLAAGDLIVFTTVYPLTLVRWASTDGRVPVLMALLTAGIAIRFLAIVLIWRGIRALAGTMDRTEAARGDGGLVGS